MQSKTGVLAAPSAGTPAHESPAGGEHGKPWAEFPRRSCARRRAPAREHKPASERPGPGERQRPHRHPCAGPTFPPGAALPRPRQARSPRGRPYDGGLEPRGHRSPRPPLWKVTRTPRARRRVPRSTGEGRAHTVHSRTGPEQGRRGLQHRRDKVAVGSGHAGQATHRVHTRPKAAVSRKRSVAWMDPAGLGASSLAQWLPMARSPLARWAWRKRVGGGRAGGTRSAPSLGPPSASWVVARPTECERGTHLPLPPAAPCAVRMPPGARSSPASGGGWDHGDRGQQGAPSGAPSAGAGRPPPTRGAAAPSAPAGPAGWALTSSFIRVSRSFLAALRMASVFLLATASAASLSGWWLTTEGVSATATLFLALRGTRAA